MSEVERILQEEGRSVWLNEEVDSLPKFPSINWNRASIVYGRSSASGGYPIFILLPSAISGSLSRRSSRQLENHVENLIEEINEFAEQDTRLRYDEIARTYHITYWIE